MRPSTLLYRRFFLPPPRLPNPLKRAFSMSEPPKECAPAAIRPAASLLILSPTNRLLLLQRTANLSFALAHVFPGGVISPGDNGNPRLCALRETFEETGLLLTTSAPPASPPLSEIQQAVHSDTLNFASWLASWGGSLIPESSMRPFTTWITPPGMKRRYKSQMFITTLPAWIPEDGVVVGDGGREVAGARWVHATAALDMALAGEIVLFPPQMYLVHHLAECLGSSTGEEGREALWARVKEVGNCVCEPRLERDLDDGTWVLGLGERGDRTVNIHLEMPKGRGGESRAVAVVKKKMREKL